MADTMRPISFLPTIKCSDCGRDIEISNMADHICSVAPADAMMKPPPPIDTRPFYGDSLSPSPSIVRQAMAPDRFQIDARRANQPRNDRQHQLTPGSASTNSKGFPTASPPRSNRRPPSPPPSDYSSFTANPYKQYADPYGMSYNKSRSPSSSYNDHASKTASSAHSPLTPDSAGGNLLKRMDSIAPGPFSSRRDRIANASVTESGVARHQRMESRDSSRQHIRVPSTEIFKGNYGKQQSISSMSDWSPGSAASTRSIGLPSRPNASLKNAQPPPPHDRSRSRGFLGDLGRSGTFPRDGESDGSEKGLVRRPTDIADMAVTPLAPRPKTSHSREPSENPFTRGRRGHQRGMDAFRSRSSSRSQGKIHPYVDDAPPVPAPAQIQNPFLGKNSHAASDSNSSSGSLSTPSLTDSSVDSRRPSEDPPSQYDSFGSKGYASNSYGNSAFRSESRHRRHNAPVPLPPSSRWIPEGPESPVDPAIQHGMLALSPDFSEASLSKTREHKVFDSTPTNDDYRISPPKSRDGSSRRSPTTTHKGNCKGCGDQIIGKSIKAADGRLTGRYHRQCFVCTTCKAPFQTADFYVHDNHPYCEFHYHQLNGSLCASCDCGIEGQYLATEDTLKFHPRCFTCVTCRTMLRDDYFEVSGGVYCELHAYEAARKNRFGSARRNPERRTTRLMMM